MTCGAAECQRKRHIDRCRVWRSANGDVASSHYEDVVVAFRERQPCYQRRWRLAQRLREIREETGPVGGGLLASLRALFLRAEKLVKVTPFAAQSGVFSGGLLDEAVTTLRGAISALGAFEASMMELGRLAL